MNSNQIYAAAKNKLTREWVAAATQPESNPMHMQLAKGGIYAMMLFQQAQIDMLKRELNLVSAAAGVGQIDQTLPLVHELLRDQTEPDLDALNDMGEMVKACSTLFQEYLGSVQSEDREDMQQVANRLGGKIEELQKAFALQTRSL